MGLRNTSDLLPIGRRTSSLYLALPAEAVFNDATNALYSIRRGYDTREPSKSPLKSYSATRLQNLTNIAGEAQVHPANLTDQHQFTPNDCFGTMIKYRRATSLAQTDSIGLFLIECSEYVAKQKFQHPQEASACRTPLR